VIAQTLLLADPAPLPGPASRPVTATSPTSTTIEDLAAQSRGGCRASFEALVIHFEKRIFHYLLQMTRNEQDAKDLTQITFVKAYQNIQRYHSHHAFQSWLFTIAKRTALNHFRDHRPTEELEPEMAADRDDPSVAAEKEDVSANIWKIARSLKPDQYEALWLRYGEGFSISETACIMKTNSLRVRVLLHRARAALAKKLERRREELPV
jgi:RNA polymerase sigma-70 factor (ECF subfamily)